MCYSYSCFFCCCYVFCAHFVYSSTNSFAFPTRISFDLTNCSATISIISPVAPAAMATERDAIPYDLFEFLLSLKPSLPQDFALNQLPQSPGLTLLLIRLVI